ncbi:MAG TPA: O-antigen ligase family protein [Chthonomonadaceae bacterium]|nr:O-antigen ligase family protein [Chthonomonadaceae bacterium]
MLLLIAGGLIPGLLAYSFGTVHEAQVIAVVIGVLFMLLIITYPFFGLIVYTGLIYARPEETFPALAGMHLTLAIAIITFIGMGAQHILEKRPIVRTPMLGLMVCFAVLAILSGVIRGQSVETITDFARLTAQVFLVLSLIRTPERYNTYVTVLIIFTTYLGLYANYLFYISGNVTSRVLADGTVLIQSRGTGIFEDPNDLAATLIPAVVLSLTRLWQVKGFKKLLYLFPMGTIIWSVLLSTSRGGLLGMLVALFAFILSFIKNKGLAIAVAILAACAFLAVAPDRMKNMDSQEQSANERLNYWHEGLLVLRRQPLYGVGYLGFQDINEGHVAHNSYVTCFAELGFPAYFCWMGMIYYAFKRRPLSITDETSATDPPDPAQDPPPPSPDIGPPVNAPPAKPKRAPLSYDLMSAQVTLLGFLAAAFWITRTYSPVLYLFLCLPEAQQLATDQKPAPPMRTKDFVKIFGLCIAMILLIYAFTLKR